MNGLSIIASEQMIFFPATETVLYSRFFIGIKTVFACGRNGLKKKHGWKNYHRTKCTPKGNLQLD
jgi:hypothetical protein